MKIGRQDERYQITAVEFGKAVPEGFCFRLQKRKYRSFLLPTCGLADIGYSENRFLGSIEYLRDEWRPAMKTKVINAAMNVQSEIVSRLHSLSDGRESEPLDPEEVGNFHGCVLGQWLSTHPELFPDVSQYLKIKTLHRLFHLQAAEAAMMLNTNRYSVDKEMLKKVVVLSQQLGDLLRKNQEETPQQKLSGIKEAHCVGWSSTRAED